MMNFYWGCARCPHVISPSQITRVPFCPYPRYLLQDVAVEIFSGDGRDFLLAFSTADRNRAYKELAQNTTGRTNILPSPFYYLFLVFASLRFSQS